MKLAYGVKDKPKAGRLILFSLQQLLAILAATIAVPMLVSQNTGANLSHSAALFGAGVGTIVYLLFTKFKSPVFLGSSFAFIGSMSSAIAGAVSMTMGYLGLLIGALFAGLVYVIIALIVKFAGVKWIDKVMPAVVIGPTVAIIGLSLAGSAIQQLTGYAQNAGGSFVMNTTSLLSILCGLTALGVTIVCSVYGKKMMKMIPFVIGILAGYALAAIFTGIGHAANVEAMKIIDFTIFKQLSSGKAWYPDFTFVTAFKGHYGKGMGAYLGTVALAYIPVAFVVFAEHLADHKNISSIIETDLLKDPGLHRTLLGDGVGSIAGAFFGGAPNTTYGESVGCVAISGNASVLTILVTAIMAMVSAFLAPFTLFLSSIPSCVMGGVCIALYGFIAVSGLKMIQKVDLGENRNLFTVSVILIAGVGGLALQFATGAGKPPIVLTEVACALILGILTNLLLNIGNKNKAEAVEADGAQENEAVAADENATEEKAEAEQEAAATEEVKE
ncbi:MAG: uracil-xanthine permease [Clostridiales bacterium]|nr:uracil-xanthine permease [Clostridiales bacterium]